MKTSLKKFMAFSSGARVSRVVYGVGLLAAMFVVPAAADTELAGGGPPVTRRLSPEQYVQTLTDIFGRDINLGGRFEAEARDNGLLAVGASRVSVTATGLERYDAMARSVAEQVVDEAHRGTLIPCKPAAANKPDDDCARKFLSATGKLLYRRPMTEQEIQIQVSAAAEATRGLGSFYDGLALSLAGMMKSPQFIFHRQTIEPDPKRPGQFRLDAYSKAAQLSFFLWNAGPDNELLAVADSGAIHSQAELERQANRLLASPRLEAGIRAFFNDMLHLDDFPAVSKDAEIYPKYTTDVARDAREQTMRTIVDHVMVRGRDYRDLFTTRDTFLTPALGTIYRVPVPPPQDNDSASHGWQPFSFPENDPRAGILTQLSFLAMHSHPGRSSPTLRGRAVREILLCQRVPDPPGAVSFAVVQDTHSETHKTARERLKAHATEAMCTGCHKLIDPMGLALENFDSAAGFRVKENGAPIDTTGEFEGKMFTDAASLGKAIHDSPAAASCLVNRVYSYATGRAPLKADAAWIKSLQEGFAADGYRVPDLLRRIATSDGLYRVTPAEPGINEAALTK